MNDLLICAKAVGYEARIIHLTDGTPLRVIAIDDKHEHFEYNPRTNDAQAWELLRKFAISLIPGRWDCIRHDTETTENIPTRWRADTKYYNGKSGEGFGETPNEAIIKAVVAMEDTHE